MFEVFGNFDTAEELNACAKGLLEEGDLEHLKILVKENGIPEAMMEGYAEGIQGELTDPINAAIGKLEIEKEVMKKDGLPTDEIISYLQMECYEDEKLARAIRRKSVSLEECMEKVGKEAERRVKERRGMQVVAIPDLEVFQMAKRYYMEAGR